MQSAIQVATKNGMPYHQRLTVNGWQIEIRPAFNEGQLPTVVHARKLGRKEE
ncbi:hypothetical protein [Thalassomonas sp. RHCl1]|uniref:hypothetical protein n=1 Tax=Thalassomonas sp. RHCl1 TaxID=2995320 RepID=UPI00248AEDC4|nr:hypothetical protein [Thalassomonas sp. RHCl1]